MGCSQPVIDHGRGTEAGHPAEMQNPSDNDFGSRIPHQHGGNFLGVVLPTETLPTQPAFSPVPHPQVSDLHHYSLKTLRVFSCSLSKSLACLIQS